LELNQRNQIRRRYRRERFNQREKAKVAGFVLIILFLIGFLTWLSWVSVQRALSSRPREKKVSRGEVRRKGSLKGVPAFARVAGKDLLLYLPAEGKDVLAIGYHEAENPQTLSLEPIGYSLKNDNQSSQSPRGTDLKSVPNDGNIPFTIMNTRGRRQSPTSAVDIAVKSKTMIRSPVDGIVTKIKPYYLYGRHQDFHLEIQPASHPELRIAIIHLDNLQVTLGSQVRKKETILGEVRSLTQYIQSQIDRYAPGNYGHTHLQVNPYIPGKEEEVPGS